MRNIKFRAFNKEKKIMYFPHALHNNPVSDLDLNGRENEVMQYTDLKDKNGKEIYEGDIIKISEVLDKKNFITDVYFNRGAFRYRHNDNSGSVMEMVTTKKIKGYEQITHDIEVIGNIYENKDLLK